MQKAVKHTMPRSNQSTEQYQSSSQLTIINDIAPSASPSTLIHINNNAATNSNTITLGDAASQFFTNNNAASVVVAPPLANTKFQKAVKHTSNVFSKDSTATSSSSYSSTGSMNKAVKHTGGGSNSYYQNKSSLNINNNRYNFQDTLKSSTSNNNLNYNNNNNNKTPVLTSLVSTPTSPLPLPTPPSAPSSTQSSQTNNKITITTTYVYKRILTQPEIDLNLECEEEEIVYIVESPKPPSPPPPPNELTDMDVIVEKVIDVQPTTLPIESANAQEEKIINVVQEQCSKVLEPVSTNDVDKSVLALDENEKVEPENKEENKDKVIVEKALLEEDDETSQSKLMLKEKAIVDSKLTSITNESETELTSKKQLVNDKKRIASTQALVLSGGGNVLSEKNSSDSTGKNNNTF
jgi:hypothetical protein